MSELAQTPANVQSKSGAEPDPSVLTTQALWREIAHSNEITNAKIEKITVQINAMEKAVALAHSNAENVTTEIDKQIMQLRQLHDEKFKSFDLALGGEHNLKEEKFNKVEQRFSLIETTRIEQKAEAANALNTALAAAKDVLNEQSKNTIAAAAKSELAFTKQIDTMNDLIKTITKAFDDKINDVKERVTKIESISLGKRDFWGYIIGAIGLLATLATIVAMIIKNSGK